MSALDDLLADETSLSFDELFHLMVEGRKELANLRAEKTKLARENEIFRKEAALPSEIYRQQNESLQEQLQRDAKEYIVMRAALEEAKEVVSNITNKMDVIADSHEYISIFQMAKIHGLEYTGDNWGNEYEKAKLWLSKWGDK